ncbi:MAG: hypothetical protein HQL71_10945 [Magnetococcales bacterium]|nr:hypothetical protein [Magnetococcales bacterium]
MNYILKAITKTCAIIDSYTTRERFLLLLTLMVTIISFWYTQYYQIKQQQITVLTNQLEAQQKTIVTMESLIAQNRKNMLQGPNTIVKQKIDHLTAQNSMLDKLLAKSGIVLHNNKQRDKIEATLIKHKGDLELYSIKQLPKKLLLKAQETNNEEKTTPKFYKYQLKLQFLGSYLESFVYLNKLKKSNLQLHWEKLSFKITNHPTGVLTIIVSSVGLQ